jgi:hypothetical protein
VLCWLGECECEANKYGSNLLCIILAERKGVTHERKNTGENQCFIVVEIVCSYIESHPTTFFDI